MRMLIVEIIKENIKPLFSNEEILTRVKEIAKEIDNYYLGEEIHVICVLKGAAIFAADLVKCIETSVRIEFIRLSSYGSSTQTSGKVHAVDI